MQLLLLRPFPRRRHLARAMLRMRSELELVVVVCGYTIPPFEAKLHPVLVVGDAAALPGPADGTAFTAGRRSRLDEAPVSVGFVPLGSAAGESWRLWFRARAPLFVRQLEPYLYWCAPAAAPLVQRARHRCEIPGRDEAAFTLTVAQEFVRTGFTTTFAPGFGYEGFVPDPGVAAGVAEPARLPEALVDLGDRLTADGDHDRALVAYVLAHESAVALWRPVEAIESAQRLGRAERFRSQWTQAERWYRHAADVAAAVGRLDLVAIAGDGLGNVALMRGAYPEARRRFAAAARTAEESGDRLARARTQHSLMIVEMDAGHHEAAIRHGLRAASLHAGEERLWALLGMVDSLVATGNIEEAERVARCVAERAGDHERAAIARSDLARIAATRGDEAAFLRLVSETPHGLSGYAMAEIRYQTALGFEALGKTSPAIAAARAAAAIAREAGVGLFVVRADQLLERLEEGRPARSAPLSLTRAARRELLALV